MAILTANFYGTYVSSVNGSDGDVLAFDSSNINEAVTPIITEATAARTALLTDRGSLIRFTNGSASSFTIPPNSVIAFPIGTTLSMVQSGAGQVTIVPGAGVTLNTEIGLKTTALNSFGTLMKVAADEWDVSGSLSA
ncbi:MAG: hypothetical protein GY746_11050 [Gammaproteobacteria bacterium]|nr:hypothetical protein [Gammaproteobacteria bacterium]